MAEAIAVISFVSAIAGLIDTGSKVVKRLNDFQSKVHDIPQTFQHVKTILPITISGLEQIRSKAQAGTLDSETQKALVPAVDGYGNQVRRLEEILGNVLPVKEDSSWDKMKKALRGLSKDKEHRNYGWTQPMPVQQTIMILAKRDLKFVDRTDILREVESNLKDYVRAAIAGIGGAGKTQIAIEHCYQFLKDCPMGNIIWAHAGTLSGFVEACKTIAGELQLHPLTFSPLLLCLNFSKIFTT
ncbi:hypothetical protein MMC22_009462 [Lobaria immixta]|nr:hypothetical protein [Lobaria immixta]